MIFRDVHFATRTASIGLQSPLSCKGHDQPRAELKVIFGEIGVFFSCIPSVLCVLLTRDRIIFGCGH